VIYSLNISVAAYLLNIKTNNNNLQKIIFGCTFFSYKSKLYEPEKYRAYVPLQNGDAFYQTLGIKPRDGMYLEDEKRFKIW